MNRRSNKRSRVRKTVVTDPILACFPPYQDGGLAGNSTIIRYSVQLQTFDGVQ